MPVIDCSAPNEPVSFDVHITKLRVFLDRFLIDERAVQYPTDMRFFIFL